MGGQGALKWTGSLWLVIALVITFASGCGALQASARADEKSGINERLLPRASFELRCPVAELKLQFLPEDAVFALVVMIEGCGKRAVYTRSSGGARWWHLESLTKD